MIVTALYVSELEPRISDKASGSYALLLAHIPQ